MKKDVDQAPDPAEIAREAARAGRGLIRDLDPDQARRLAEYITLLLKWNRSMNLVGRVSWNGIMADLVMDSLHLADFLAGLSAELSAGLGLPASPRCLDFGAGAGLPGIPLRLVWTPGTYLLVETRERRAAFLRTAVGLVLPGGRTRVFAGRVENLPPEELPADLILSRAFAPWPEYLALARPLLAPGGMALVMTSGPPPSPEELAAKAPGYVLTASKAYPAPGGERYFWGLAPASISR